MNEQNFARFDAKQEQRWAQFETSIARALSDLRVELKGDITRIDARLERALKEQSRWMLGGVITLVAIAAMWFQLLQLATRR